MLRSQLAPFALLYLTACSSFSTLHTARPIPKGETDVTLAVSGLVFEDDDGDTEVLPFGLEYMLRHGFSENLDGGFKVSNFSTLQGDLNYALYQGDALAVSVDPIISYTRIGSSFTDREENAINLTYLWLPLLVDVFRNEAMTLTLSGRIGRVIVTGSGSLADVGIAGTGSVYGIGAGARFHVSETLDLLTEFNVVFPIGDEVADEPLYMFSLGVSF